MPDDGEMGDVSAGRGAESLGTGRYEIDAHAVAEVILARLAVGGTCAFPKATPCLSPARRKARAGEVSEVRRGRRSPSTAGIEGEGLQVESSGERFAR